MAYRKVYFRIHTEGYVSGWSSDSDKAAFKEESRRLFKSLGWTLTLGHNRCCDTVTKGQQDLYLHPSSFSGVLDEDNIQSLQEQLSKAQTFRCYHTDRYEEYRDLSDEGYRAELEAKRDEITEYILKKCRTTRRNLYIVAPVAVHVAEHFEIRRLGDRAKAALVALPIPINYGKEELMVPEDISNVIVFLASPMAHGVNGNIMFVDGGTDALLNSEKVY